MCDLADEENLSSFMLCISRIGVEHWFLQGISRIGVAGFCKDETGSWFYFPLKLCLPLSCPFILFLQAANSLQCR